MSRLALILSVSLAANAILAVVAWQRASAPRNNPMPPSLAVNASPNAPAGIAPDMWARLTETTPDDTFGSAAENDVTLLARLRAAGFPAEALRALFKHRIDARFAPRELALIHNQPKAPYWTANRANHVDAPETRSARRALTLEKAQLLRQLLGDDADSPSDRLERARRYGPLDGDKADRLDAMLADYSDLENAVRIGNVLMLPEDREKLALIESERQRDLSALLSPEELAAYEARASRTASSVQRQLQEFHASEAEYLAIVALKTEFTDTWGNTSSGLSREKRAARNEAEKQLESSLADALGPERYADYTAKSDISFLLAKQLTDQLGLPAENAMTVAALQKNARSQLQTISRDRSLTMETRMAQLRALQAEARQAVNAALTPEGADIYAKSLGQWIESIVPPVTPGS